MALAVLASSDAGDECGGATGRIEKRPGAFRTISEVAQDLGVPQHVLRFWESRFAQVRPIKRAGGRRYYRPEDVDLLKGIRRLLHGQGYTIKGAQRILRQHGVRFVQEVGRGEAEAGAPPPTEREPDAGPVEAGVPASADSILHAVLGDLRACRAALTGLWSGAIAQDAEADEA